MLIQKMSAYKRNFSCRAERTRMNFVDGIDRRFFHEIWRSRGIKCIVPDRDSRSRRRPTVYGANATYAWNNSWGGNRWSTVIAVMKLRKGFLADGKRYWSPLFARRNWFSLPALLTFQPRADSSVRFVHSFVSSSRLRHPLNFFCIANLSNG